MEMELWLNMLFYILTTHCLRALRKRNSSAGQEVMFQKAAREVTTGLCSHDAMDHKSRTKGTHFCTVCPSSHSWYFYIQTMTKVLVRRMTNESFSEKFKPCPLSHLYTLGWSKQVHKVSTTVRLAFFRKLYKLYPFPTLESCGGRGFQMLLEDPTSTLFEAEV